LTVLAHDFFSYKRLLNLLGASVSEVQDATLPSVTVLPRLRRLGYRQRPHEVAKVLGQRMELEADGIGGEGMIVAST
jgi:hypothetical protein